MLSATEVVFGLQNFVYAVEGLEILTHYLDFVFGHSVGVLFATDLVIKSPLCLGLLDIHCILVLLCFFHVPPHLPQLNIGIINDQ